MNPRRCGEDARRSGREFLERRYRVPTMGTFHPDYPSVLLNS